MNLWRYALRSLQSRFFLSLFIVLILGLSLVLFLSIRASQHAAKHSFETSIAGVDLIVGPRTGSLSLLFYTVFNIGVPTHNMSHEAYLDLKDHPATKWALPISLGDSHRGFRVIATEPEFFKLFQLRGSKHLAFAQGEAFGPQGNSVVCGYLACQNLGYEPGDEIILSHGIGDTSFTHHEDQPFEIVGALEKTGTPVDRAFYISLPSMQIIHDLDPESTESITATFLKLESKLDILFVQREINETETEALSAIVPGFVLSDLWSQLSYFETTLVLIAALVMVFSFATLVLCFLILVSLRVREIGILKSQGASAPRVISLIVTECSFLVLLSVGFAVVLVHSGIFLLQDWFETHYSLMLQHGFWSSFDIGVMLCFVAFGILAGLAPGLKAYRIAVYDQLAR